MSTNYTYLFPYEKIPQGSRIVIYGAGDVGQEYLQQMLITGFAEVVAFIDRAYDKYPPMVIPILPPEKVSELNFDFVVLAFKMGANVRVVTKNLIDFGVEYEKIIYIEPRHEAEVMVSVISDIEVKPYEFAYLKNDISVALKYGPGLGDAVVKKKFFTELVAMANNCNVDIYTPGASGIIKSIYSDEANLNAVIDDGGALYANEFSHYDLSLTINFMLEIDSINKERLQRLNPAFAAKMEKLSQALKDYALNSANVVSRYAHIHRMKFLGLDYYTYFNHTGVFNVKDHKVNIPLNPDYKEKFAGLNLPDKYITVNYGGGVNAADEDNKVAKDWPLAYLEKFAQLFKAKYKDVGVIQVGSKGTHPIEGVDLCLIGVDFELVKYILKNSLIHIDKEGGLVHLATQLETKCVVCFGPTQSEFFGYAENINIQAANCHGCYCLYDGYDVCARNMEKPECMWSITPEMVMEKVEEYFKDALR